MNTLDQLMAYHEGKAQEYAGKRRAYGVRPSLKRWEERQEFHTECLKTLKEIISFQTFDWATLDKSDAVGVDRHPPGIYILKGFHKDTNNYKRLFVPLPQKVIDIIWDEATHRAQETH